MKQLILMPLLQCNANCIYCSRRQDRHRKAQDERTLTLEQLCDLVDQGAALGADRLVLSGGEPTLYPGLAALVRQGKQQGLHVNVNTNGIGVSEDLVAELAAAGLDACMVSLTSHEPEVHDAFRQVPGAFESALRTIELFRRHGVQVTMQAILTNRNLACFDQYLETIIPLQPERVFVSYLEGPDAELRPDADDIRRYRQTVYPRCRRVLMSKLTGNGVADVLGHLGPFRRFFPEGPSCRAQSDRTLRHLFRFEGVTDDDVGRGYCNPAGFMGCSNNRRSCLVLATGDVLPCVGSQYYPTPPVGNVLNASLASVWNSQTWDTIRREGQRYCRMCPVRHHFSLAITSST